MYGRNVCCIGAARGQALWLGGSIRGVEIIFETMARALNYCLKVRMGVCMASFTEVVKVEEMPIFIVVGGTGIEPVTPAV